MIVLFIIKQVCCSKCYANTRKNPSNGVFAKIIKRTTYENANDVYDQGYQRKFSFIGEFIIAEDLT